MLFDEHLDTVAILHFELVRSVIRIDPLTIEDKTD